MINVIAFSRRALAAALLIAAAHAAAADQHEGAGDPLFQSDDLLEVRIAAPLQTLQRERSDTEDLEGRFEVLRGGEPLAVDIKVRARGRYRRKDETCDFPPVRLDFARKEVRDTLLDGQNKLKLVTHCDNRRDYYEQYVLKEYLAYRILNLLTDYSFRARLLQVTWSDTERNGEEMTRYGFLIEDDDRLGKRIGAKRAEVPHSGYELLHQEQAALISVYEYLIGNTDFSMVAGPADDICCHNVVLYEIEPGVHMPIPYDFDFSGIVDARYATPNPRFRIRSVTKRLYRGRCDHNPLLDSTLERFRERRPAIMALVEEIPGMTPNTRKKAMRYIEGFYKDVADARGVERRLVKGCS